jgi:hypothetical protein
VTGQRTKIKKGVMLSSSKHVGRPLRATLRQAQGDRPPYEDKKGVILSLSKYGGVAFCACPFDRLRVPIFDFSL